MSGYMSKLDMNMQETLIRIINFNILDNNVYFCDLNISVCFNDNSFQMIYYSIDLPIQEWWTKFGEHSILIHPVVIYTNALPKLGT